MAGLWPYYAWDAQLPQCTSTPSKGFVYSQTAEELMAKWLYEQ